MLKFVEDLELRKYDVTWKHEFGGVNTEAVFAASPADAVKAVMRKYDDRYHLCSVRVA